MTIKAPIIIHALVDGAEAAAIQHATAQLSAALKSIAEQYPAIRCEVLSAESDLADVLEPSILITSLLSEVAHYRDPWIAVEQRLLADYESLASRPNLDILICTVFRHVPWEREFETVEPRRVRIRQLNLFAAELSRRLGICVIDLDRDLADIGARSLQTDYRLGGNVATEVVARSICRTLLSAGALDRFVSVEDQTAAKVMIAAQPVPIAATVAPTAQLSDRPVIAMRTGDRIQQVSPTKPIAQEDYVTWLLNGILRRRIGLTEAASMLARSIRRRGLPYHAGLLFHVIARYVKTQSRRRR